MTQWSGAVLVGGTSSDAGKSLVVAGLCRLLHRNGISVAPFKAQNMSNNSVVTADGGEIGRAQYMQAQACGLTPSVRFNPVLLKPGSDRRSQVVVRGRAIGTVGARDYHRDRAALASVVARELASLREQFDVVVIEGAGSVAEINLRTTDIANMGLAQNADIPVVVVGDIDRGGVLAHLIGTVAALDDSDQRRIRGFIINKFRGDPTILQPGVEDVSARTSRPVLGVLPYSDRLWLDAEDSLATQVGTRLGPPSTAPVELTVAAIRLPRISNTTDIEALACEPGVDVRWVDDPASVQAADLVILPGSKATVHDLAWLRSQGLDAALVRRAGNGGAVLGICGGFQMLARSIVDEVESDAGLVSGLGLLPVSIRFDRDKTLRNVSGTAWGATVSGYEIHHGRVEDSTAECLIALADGTGEGAQVGNIAGTHLHGVFAYDDARRRYLASVAESAGRPWRPDNAAPGYQAQRVAQWDLMADLIEEHLDLDQLATIVGGRSDVPDTLTMVRSRLG